jgi:aryl-alcohol dehydrogenase-like predicted oxidoreductase
MISIWGGWTLFQKLLETLQKLATKRSVSIANIAVRWVLDHDFVGAVIVGARMGITDHVIDNSRVYGWTLDNEDKSMLEAVLGQSKRIEVFGSLGDCGAEYRQ